MSTVDIAPPAAALVLTDDTIKLFVKRDQPKQPSIVTLQGSSNLNLTVFNATATGTAKAEVPGTLTLTLYGRAQLDDATADPATWLPLASTPPEPIGGETDLPEAMFMIQGFDLMVNSETGKLQGEFKSNVASHPMPPIDLEQHPGDITDEDPLYVFAVGASFAPEGTPPPTKAGEEPPPLCTVTLASLTLNA